MNFGSTFETIPRSHGIDDGLAARVFDPLWLLARQWQFGEFRGEEAASISHVDIDVEYHVVDQWRPFREPDWRPYARDGQPLEEAVEAEPVVGADPRLRVEGGLRLRRLLRDRGADVPDALVAAHGFGAGEELEPPDALALVRRAVPDGAQLVAPLTRLVDPSTRDQEAAALGLAPDVAASLAAVAGEWLTWWTARAPGPVADGTAHPPTWDENRLEYQFAARASTMPGTQLVASGYTGGRLDWWSVDALVDPFAEAGAAGRRLSARSIPAPAHYGGMPVARFWEMEDARFDFGSTDAGPIDLGRLLVVGFATVYGNDWFVLPIRLPVASLMRFTRFTVTDVFGREVELDRAGADADGWNVFGTTDISTPVEPGVERPTLPWFFLAAPLTQSLESEPAETVLLLRDEMANLAWAVESVVSDDAGRQRRRFDEWVARNAARPEPPPPDGALPPRYRVDTDVPDYWYPLAPDLADRESVLLRLAPLARRVDGEVTTALPIGRLLATARSGAMGAVWLHEEEVPRAGATVVRTHQQARWHDGSVRTWTGRRKTTGSGEGSSGLRFDVVERR